VELRAEFRAGTATFEKKLAVCSGGAGLSPEDRVELLTVIAGDPAFLDRATNALLTQPLQSFLTALARPDAAPELFVYCAENLAGKASVADAMSKNSACPVEDLVRVGRSLSVSGVQALLEHVERLAAAPILIAVLLRCPSITAEQRELLQELERGPATEKELEEAVELAEPDRQKRATLLQRLARMNVVERVQLALKGGREERMALIRDSCKIVQRAVLQSPRLTDTEVEAFSAMTSLTAETLRQIAMNRLFLKNYTIVRNLLNNPKAPLEVTLHMLPRLVEKDLKMLTMNKNIPEVLRTAAFKLYRQRGENR
jgi:hypothetical protein